MTNGSRALDYFCFLSAAYDIERTTSAVVPALQIFPSNAASETIFIIGGAGTPAADANSPVFGGTNDRKVAI